MTSRTAILILKGPCGMWLQYAEEGRAANDPEAISLLLSPATVGEPRAQRIQVILSDVAQSVPAAPAPDSADSELDRLLGPSNHKQLPDAAPMMRESDPLF